MLGTKYSKFERCAPKNGTTVIIGLSKPRFHKARIRSLSLKRATIHRETNPRPEKRKRKRFRGCPVLASGYHNWSVRGTSLLSCAVTFIYVPGFQVIKCWDMLRFLHMLRFLRAVSVRCVLALTCGSVYIHPWLSNGQSWDFVPKVLIYRNIEVSNFFYIVHIERVLPSIPSHSCVSIRRHYRDKNFDVPVSNIELVSNTMK